MFFVIPEMPSKTFVMLQKKLPDHFNYNMYIVHAALAERERERKREKELIIMYKWKIAECPISSKSRQKGGKVGPIKIWDILYVVDGSTVYLAHP